MRCPCRVLRSMVAACVILAAGSARAADPALVEAAKKEGEVIWYTTQIISQLVRPVSGVREEIRHQGPLDARQLDRAFGQDHQRKPGGQAAI